jgi:predicted HicB family RNase H-like nuclease
MHETKIHLNELLHRWAKAKAAERGLSLKGYIEGLVVLAHAVAGGMKPKRTAKEKGKP